MSSITSNVFECRDTRDVRDTSFTKKSPNQMRNLRVHFGIDEDLRMILEMDPSIIDLGVSNIQDYSPKPTRVVGLPPKSGGYVIYIKKKQNVFFIR